MQMQLSGNEVVLWGVSWDCISFYQAITAETQGSDANGISCSAVSRTDGVAYSTPATIVMYDITSLSVYCTRVELRMSLWVVGDFRFKFFLTTVDSVAGLTVNYGCFPTT